MPAMRATDNVEAQVSTYAEPNMCSSTFRVLSRLTHALATTLMIGGCAGSRGAGSSSPDQPTVTATTSGTGATSVSTGGAGGGVASTTVPVPGGCNTPRTGPADAVGCYVAGTDLLGAAPASPLFWHLDAYPTRAAAESARQGRGTVVEAHGRIWLFTIAEAEWRPGQGKRVAPVGPLPLTPGRTYAVHYIEGVVPPQARTPVHRHAGPEAWYVLEGTNCLVTPEGTRLVRAGESLIIPEGPPMLLTGVGSTLRRTFAVVVHDAAQPWTIPASDWTPTATCTG